MPVSLFNGYFVEPDEIVLDTVHHTHINGTSRKLEENIRIKVAEPNILKISEDGRVNNISSRSAMETFHKVWESLTGGFPGSLLATYIEDGSGRKEVQKHILGLMIIHGVPSPVRTRIENALNRPSLSVEYVVGLVTDTQAAIHHMESYGIGHYGRDEATADFVAIRIAEMLAPEIAHVDIDVDISDYREYQEVRRSLPAYALSDHILSAHLGLGKYHSALPNLACYITDIRDSR